MRFAKASIEAATLEQYTRRAKLWFKFCKEYESDPWLAPAHKIQAFCVYINKTVSAQSIKSYLSGIKTLFDLLGHRFQWNVDGV